MAFDAYCYFPGSNIEGETTDDTMGPNNAFELQNFELGAENAVDIGSQVGASRGARATFKSLTFTKQTDTASTTLLAKLLNGSKLDDMVIELRRSGEGEGVAGVTYLKFEFKSVYIADMAWSGAGDDPCTESLEVKFGAIKATYQPSGADPIPTEWSTVKNSASFSV